jgi:hypothetical protein
LPQLLHPLSLPPPQLHPHCPLFPHGRSRPNRLLRFPPQHPPVPPLPHPHRQSPRLLPLRRPHPPHPLAASSALSKAPRSCIPLCTRSG